MSKLQKVMNVSNTTAKIFVGAIKVHANDNSAMRYEGQAKICAMYRGSASTSTKPIGTLRVTSTSPDISKNEVLALLSENFGAQMTSESIRGFQEP